MIYIDKIVRATSPNKGAETMKWVEDYVDEYKDKLNLPSDYAVAQRLEVSRQMINKVRKGDVLGRETLISIARTLKREPIELIATAEAEKAKNPDLKAMWIKLAKEKGNK